MAGLRDMTSVNTFSNSQFCTIVYQQSVPAIMPDSRLSPVHAHALFNILSHREVYAEAESFKYTKAIEEYGPPFQPEHEVHSTSPSLQSLVARVLLPLPGLRDVATSFWPSRVQPILTALASANLSESYDKGICGQRRTVVTAVCTLLEYPSRGFFGGCPLPPAGVETKKYDESSPVDAAAAWHDAIGGAVYGNVIDELFAKAAETDKLSEHTSLIRAAHKFIILKYAPAPWNRSACAILEAPLISLQSCIPHALHLDCFWEGFCVVVAS